MLSIFLAIACSIVPYHTASALRAGTQRDETDATLVSSRGLLKSCNVRPDTLKSGARSLLFGVEANTSNALSHYVEDIRYVGDGASVYVVTTALKQFVHQVLPHVKTHFTLVTGDSTDSPTQVLGEAGVAKLAADRRVIRWFAQNAADGEAKFSKVIPMPLGLDYHSHIHGASEDPVEQEKSLLALRKAAPIFSERSPKVFYTGTVTSKTRAQVVERLDNQRHVVEMHAPMAKDAYLAQMGRHQFVASPPGRGQDCHRTYEALAMGAIPIVSRSLHRFFKRNSLNVVELEDGDWKNLTSVTVRKKFRRAEKRYDARLPQAMYLRYWTDRINKGLESEQVPLD
jgi:hypothetical protein